MAYLAYWGRQYYVKATFNSWGVPPKCMLHYVSTGLADITMYEIHPSCTQTIIIVAIQLQHYFLLTIKQANGVIAVISLLSWIEPTSFTWPLRCEVRSLNTAPRCSSGTMTTMLVQGSSSCTSAFRRALDTHSVMHEERTGSDVTLPRVREVTATWMFWTGNANKGPIWYKVDKFHH